MYMIPVSKRVTNHCTPRPCSSAVPAGYNLGTKDDPKWIYIGTAGHPFQGQVPKSFEPKEAFRTGVVSTASNGIYTKTQRNEMITVSQVGDSRSEIIGHLATVVGASSTWFGTSAIVDTKLQNAFQSASNSFPYNLLTYIPLGLRIIAFVIVVILFAKWFLDPLITIINASWQTGQTFSNALRALLCQNHVISKQYNTIATLVDGQQQLEMKVASQDTAKLTMLEDELQSLRARVTKLEPAHLQTTPAPVARATSSIGGTTRPARSLDKSRTRRVI
jgi:hypothetical protein